jgi:hypothetical protein
MFSLSQKDQNCAQTLRLVEARPKQYRSTIPKIERTARAGASTGAST